MIRHGSISWNHLKYSEYEILENFCLCLSLLKGEFPHHRRKLRGQKTSCLRQLSPAISGEAPCLSAFRAWGQLAQTDPPFHPSSTPWTQKRRRKWVRRKTGNKGKEAGVRFCGGNNCNFCLAAVFRTGKLYIREFHSPQRREVPPWTPVTLHASWALQPSADLPCGALPWHFIGQFLPTSCGVNDLFRVDLSAVELV